MIRAIPQSWCLRAALWFVCVIALGHPSGVHAKSASPVTNARGHLLCEQDDQFAFTDATMIVSAPGAIAFEGRDPAAQRMCIAIHDDSPTVAGELRLHEHLRVQPSTRYALQYRARVDQCAGDAPVMRLTFADRNRDWLPPAQGGERIFAVSAPGPAPAWHAVCHTFVTTPLTHSLFLYIAASATGTAEIALDDLMLVQLSAPHAMAIPPARVGVWSADAGSRSREFVCAIPPDATRVSVALTVAGKTHDGSMLLGSLYWSGAAGTSDSNITTDTCSLECSMMIPGDRTHAELVWNRTARSRIESRSLWREPVPFNDDDAFSTTITAELPVPPCSTQLRVVMPQAAADAAQHVQKIEVSRLFDTTRSDEPPAQHDIQ